MIEENSGPAKSAPLSEVSHLASVPLSEVLLYSHMSREHFDKTIAYLYTVLW